MFSIKHSLLTGMILLMGNLFADNAPSGAFPNQSSTAVQQFYNGGVKNPPLYNMGAGYYPGYYGGSYYGSSSSYGYPEYGNGGALYYNPFPDNSSASVQKFYKGGIDKSPYNNTGFYDNVPFPSQSTPSVQSYYDYPNYPYQPQYPNDVYPQQPDTGNYLYPQNQINQQVPQYQQQVQQYQGGIPQGQTLQPAANQPLQPNQGNQAQPNAPATPNIYQNERIPPNYVMPYVAPTTPTVDEAHLQQQKLKDNNEW